MRHPASGYVQGINDLVTPFFLVFLGDYMSKCSDPISIACYVKLVYSILAISNTFEDCDISKLPSDKLAMLEADCFWCVSKLLDGIQVNILLVP